MHQANLFNLTKDALLFRCGKLYRWELARSGLFEVQYYFTILNVVNCSPDLKLSFLQHILVRLDCYTTKHYPKHILLTLF